jgi:diacylglycerol kinase (ATP)
MRALTLSGPGKHEKSLAALRGAGLSLEPWRKSDSDSADLIVVLGGDGTIHRHLPRLIQAKTPVLIVPDGSGNDLARALNIHSVATSWQLAYRFVRRQQSHKDIDIGVIADSSGQETPFSCVGGIGLDPIAAEFANRMPRWLRSRGGCLLSVARALLSPPVLRLRIRADGREIQQNSCLFSFANTPTFGGGLRIAPQAQVDDGLLDCVLVDAMSTLQLSKRVPSLLKGAVLGLKEVAFVRSKTLRIESDPPAWVYADGESVCQTPINVRVLRQAMRVVADKLS